MPANPPHSANRPTPNIDYLTQLIKDKKQLSAFPNVFTHLERLLDDGTYLSSAFVPAMFGQILISNFAEVARLIVVGLRGMSGIYALVRQMRRCESCPSGT